MAANASCRQRRRGNIMAFPLDRCQAISIQAPRKGARAQEGHSYWHGGRPPRSALYPMRKGLFVTALPKSIDETLALLASAHYLADRSLATVLFLALRMGRPIFLEGEAGVGKTEIAKGLSATPRRRLIRLQCYEGLDVAGAGFEWNYARPMIRVRLAAAGG